MIFNKQRKNKEFIITSVILINILSEDKVSRNSLNTLEIFTGVFPVQSKLSYTINISYNGNKKQTKS